MAQQQASAQDAQAVKNLTGLERSALLMLGLGEKHAAEILRHMGPKEVQEIGLAMASLSNVTNSQMELVMQKFVDAIGEQTSLGMGSDEYIRNMLTSALGSDKASGIIDRILLGRNSKGLEQLKWMDPRAIAELIRLEHPQIAAFDCDYRGTARTGLEQAEFAEYLPHAEIAKAGLDMSPVVQLDTPGDPHRARLDQVDTAVRAAFHDDRLPTFVAAQLGNAGRDQPRI